ncbi:MAG: sodium:solute symporter family protein [Actinomycetaceae bacterium]|nr:sodium:solute symporter family protein [Actinomycetaceae bacterium]
MVFSIAILASFVIYLIIGAIVSRTIKDKDDYYVSGRNAPTVLVGGTLVASYMSTVTFLGEIGFAYDGYPVALGLITPLNIAGYGIGVMFFGRYLRRSEALTVPEFFGKRFSSPTLQMITGLTVVVGIGFYLIAVTQGMSLIIQQLTGINPFFSLLTVWIGYTIFTLLSGARGVLINDTIMYFIFTIAAVGGVGWLFYRAGGPTEAFNKMRNLADMPDALTWHGTTGPDAYMGTPGAVLMWGLTLGIVWMLVVAVSPWQSSRYLMAKNEHVSIRSALMATVSIGFLYVFVAFGGLLINVFNPNINPSEVAFVWAAQNAMPPVLGVLAVTGIVAAGLSSAASFLSLIGFSIDNDVMPWLANRRKKLDIEKRDVNLTRTAMLTVGIIALVATYFATPAVLEIGYFAATLFAASWGPLAFWSIRSEKLTERGAIAGVVTGFLIVALFESLSRFGGIDFPIWANPVLIGIGGSLIAIVLGNRNQQPREESIAFLRSLRSIPRENVSVKEYKTTRLWVIGSLIVIASYATFLLVFYALPN